MKRSVPLLVLSLERARALGVCPPPANDVVLRLVVDNDQSLTPEKGREMGTQQDIAREIREDLREVADDCIETIARRLAALILRRSKGAGASAPFARLSGDARGGGVVSRRPRLPVPQKFLVDARGAAIVMGISLTAFRSRLHRGQIPQSAIVRSGGRVQFIRPQLPGGK